MLTWLRILIVSLCLCSGSSYLIAQSDSAEVSREQTSIPSLYHVPDIYFNVDDWRLSGNAWEVLDSVATIMKLDTHVHLLLTCYTDTFGDAGDNYFLSMKRGDKVEEYLIALGVAGGRIAVLPYGERKSDGSDPARERRVEFIFTP